MKKIIKYIFLISGVCLVISALILSIANIYLGLLIFLIGLFFIFIYKKSDNLNFEKQYNNTDAILFHSYIAGITHENDNGESIQKCLKTYLCNIIEKENIEEYEFEENNTIQLIFEKNNKFDENAIKIIHKSIGKIGFVPAKDNIEVGKILKTNKNLDFLIRFIFKNYKNDNYNKNIYADFYIIKK